MNDGSSGIPELFKQIDNRGDERQSRRPSPQCKDAYHGPSPSNLTPISIWAGEGDVWQATNNAEDIRARRCASIFLASVVAGLVALSMLRRLITEYYWAARCDVPVRRLCVIRCCALWLAQRRELRQAKGIASCARTGSIDVLFPVCRPIRCRPLKPFADRPLITNCVWCLMETSALTAK